MTFLRRGRQAHSQGQNWWPNLKPNIQSICNITFLVPSQSNHTFWYNKFSICPCKFTVNGMAKTKIDGFICSPSFNRYVCLSFHIANSTFSLRYKQLESNPWQFKVKPRWKLIAIFEASHSMDKFAFRFRGNRPIFPQTEYLTMKIQGKGHGQKWSKSNEIIYRSAHSHRSWQNERNMKSCSDVIAWTKVTPGNRGDLKSTSSYKIITLRFACLQSYDDC